MTIPIKLDGVLSMYDGEEMGAEYLLRPACEGWVITPGNNDRLYREMLSVD